MARKSNPFSELAYVFFRAGLTAYLLDAQSKSTRGAFEPQVPQSRSEEVEFELFPDQKARVQQFRIQQQAAAKSGSKAPHSRIKIKKEHRERAWHDYENARGTIHRRLLLDAEPRLQTMTREAHKQAVSLKEEARRLESARRRELFRAVVRPLVARELPTLPGIGPRLADAIQAQVFNGDLDSLRMAYMIERIGPQKQATINAWIDQQTPLLLDLLDRPFPEKAVIVARYDHEIDEKDAELSRAKTHEKEYRNVLKRVYDELDWLMAVTQGDFELTYGNRDAAHEQISRYLLGVFSPWEPMPDWFTRALEASGQTDNLTASQTANFTRPARA